MSPLRQTAIKYGVVCGAIRIVAYLIEAASGMLPMVNLNAFFIDQIIFFGFVLFAIKEFKDYKNGGILHFWQGISIGLIIIFVSSVIFSVFEATYYVVDETVFQSYLKNAIDFFDSQKESKLELIPLEEFNAQRKGIQETTILGLVSGNFVKKLIVGFLVVPLVAVLLRKHKN